MKISAIICEFNPIHSGHKRLIDYAKTFSNKVVCIMSGNFVQRGMPACADKFSRAKHAVLCGADMVVELPTIFAVSSAENFALGGVKIAKQIAADYLVFGSECGNIDELSHAANLIENADVNKNIKQNLSEGLSYPKAVAKAVGSDILDKPNNVLAIEYLRAIQKTNCKLTPVTLQRNSDYHSAIAEAYASSTALRANKELLGRYSFDFVEQDLATTAEHDYKQFACRYLSLLNNEQWQTIEGVSEGIENRFIRADKSRGYDNLTEQVKTKRYTLAKIQRIVLNAVLDITSDKVEKTKQKTQSVVPLAVKKGSETLLERTFGQSDDTTTKADRLYYSLTGKSAPTKLQVIAER